MVPFSIQPGTPPSTAIYDHRYWKTRDPVRSPLDKSVTARLVVGSVTTSESLVLYIYFLALSFCPNNTWDRAALNGRAQGQVCLQVENSIDADFRGRRPGMAPVRREPAASAPERAESDEGAPVLIP
jgi:hypothetical protein